MVGGGDRLENEFLKPIAGRIHPAKGYKTFLERFASSKVGAWFFVNVAPAIDRRLVRLSGGRISMALIRPVTLLSTTGARSGQKRTTPLLFFRKGEDVVLIASYGGNPCHPAWYHNLKANPECELFVGGHKGLYTAREAEDEERERLWLEANKLYRGYGTYQGRTRGRKIPVMVLSPR